MADRLSGRLIALNGNQEAASPSHYPLSAIPFPGRILPEAQE